MRNLPRALLAGGLGFATSLVAACGAGSGLLTPSDASSLSSQLAAISSAVSSRQCVVAEGAVTSLSNLVVTLPPSVDSTLRRNLADGASTVGQLAARDCRNPRTTTGTTSKQPSSTTSSTTTSSTTTLSTTTSTTSSSTTTTTTTSSTSSTIPTTSSTTTPVHTTTPSTTQSSTTPPPTSAPSQNTTSTGGTGGAGLGGSGGGGGAGLGVGG